MFEHHNKYLLGITEAMDTFLKEKMDEKEKEGLIINRDVIEEIMQELKDKFKNNE